MSLEAARVRHAPSDVIGFIPSHRWEQLSTDIINMQTIHQRGILIGGNSPFKKNACKSMSTELPTAQRNSEGAFCGFGEYFTYEIYIISLDGCGTVF